MCAQASIASSEGVMAVSQESAALGAAHGEYRDTLGWSTMLRPCSVELALDGSIGAVAMRAGIGGQVASILCTSETCGPVIAVPGAPPSWVFLVVVEPGERDAPVPAYTRLLAQDQSLPLPPSWTPGGQIRWVIRPKLVSGRLPSLSTVFNAIRTVAYPRHWA